MKKYSEYLEEVSLSRFEELTQNTIDFKTNVQGKIQVVVKDEKTGKVLINKIYAGDLLVKQILNDVSSLANLRPKVDPNIERVKEKTIESITDNSIIEFQINQNGVLVLNAQMINKPKATQHH